ncbi:MAG: flagellar biosynthesis anti-sigma factor FlgM [Spirochaetia bacterium]|nr:flagellar biosynthesis anti-sigma factor FlgM [Spirochaetia bacterium]
MTINSLGGVSQIEGCTSIEKSVQSVRISEADSISVSSEAKAMGEVYAISEDLHTIPDIRMDKVEAAIQKLQDPNYINQAVINSVADKIADMFGV